MSRCRRTIRASAGPISRKPRRFSAGSRRLRSSRDYARRSNTSEAASVLFRWLRRLHARWIQQVLGAKRRFRPLEPFAEMDPDEVAMVAINAVANFSLHLPIGML